MSLAAAKTKLDELSIYLQQKVQPALDLADDQRFVEASNSLALIINHAELELALAGAKWVCMPNQDQPVDNLEAVNEVRILASTLHQQVAELQIRKQGLIKSMRDKEFNDEVDALNLKREERARRETIVNEYYSALNKLEGFKTQKQPYMGVEVELNYFLAQVSRFKKDNSISTPELTQAMNAAIAVLCGGTKATFDEVTKDLHAKSSTPLKILGGALLALGLAVAVSGIFFAPAIIMSTASLSTVYAATLATAAVSSALTIGGTSCFFKNTPSMQLADALKPMSREELEETHYTRAGTNLG